MTAKFMLPFPDKQLTGHFGKIRTFKGAPSNPHRGTDWAGKEGTPIPAVAKGTIKLVKWSDILGWVIVQTVMGNDKKVMYVGYCHLKNEPKLKVGDKVEMGDTVGLLGNSGSFSSGPHLHATLSDSLKGVFAGNVYDLYKYLQDNIKNPPTSPTEPQKVAEPAKIEEKAPETPNLCPTCGQEVKNA